MYKLIYTVHKVHPLVFPPACSPSCCAIDDLVAWVVLALWRPAHHHCVAFTNEVVHWVAIRKRSLVHLRHSVIGLREDHWCPREAEMVQDVVVFVLQGERTRRGTQSNLSMHLLSPLQYPHSLVWCNRTPPSVLQEAAWKATVQKHNKSGRHCYHSQCRGLIQG